ncbi:hypothetical protein [Beggiatoa leptomitoformis]|uniref:Uncharacterized protein n=1 Tax=Beggiatoa leptomitoformis TaxID=288004 RepID=A0A2N9YCU9_9GAMM|nr:hypothetical protein [Beggiatoa leptomitoformis]ALG66436.1 hypothetical protein AL038_00135 [Beggiatoa leptomitoformis]AUI68285.1 hypothetical protein BLE401_05940 [Beggiatoa leptomitoformis]
MIIAEHVANEIDDVISRHLNNEDEFDPLEALKIVVVTSLACNLSFNDMTLKEMKDYLSSLEKSVFESLKMTGNFNSVMRRANGEQHVRAD